MKSKIEMIAHRSAANLKMLVVSMEDDINEAISAAYELAQEEGKEAVKVTLSHAIVLDLGGDEMEDTLSVSVRHRGRLKSTLPDPNQPELFEEGGEG
jgi:hypothetical protein